MELFKGIDGAEVAFTAGKVAVYALIAGISILTGIFFALQAAVSVVITPIWAIPVAIAAIIAHIVALKTSWLTR